MTGQEALDAAIELVDDLETEISNLGQASTAVLPPNTCPLIDTESARIKDATSELRALGKSVMGLDDNDEALSIIRDIEQVLDGCCLEAIREANQNLRSAAESALEALEAAGNAALQTVNDIQDLTIDDAVAAVVA